jgi:hypothetical protein
MSEFGFSGEGEKLTPSEELAHLLDTYGGVESIPSDIKERILAEMRQYGDARSLEEVAESMSEDNLMNAA